MLHWSRIFRSAKVIWRIALCVAFDAGMDFCWRLAAFFIASPLPLSNAFFVRDFEGFWRGELVGGADCEASASRRNADAAVSLWLGSLGKQFEDEGSSVPIWD